MVHVARSGWFPLAPLPSRPATGRGTNYPKEMELSYPMRWFWQAKQWTPKISLQVEINEKFNADDEDSENIASRQIKYTASATTLPPADNTPPGARVCRLFPEISFNVTGLVTEKNTDENNVDSESSAEFSAPCNVQLGQFYTEKLPNIWAGLTLELDGRDFAFSTLIAENSPACVANLQIDGVTIPCGLQVRGVIEQSESLRVAGNISLSLTSGV